MSVFNFKQTGGEGGGLERRIGFTREIELDVIHIIMKVNVEFPEDVSGRKEVINKREQRIEPLGTLEEKDEE